MRLARRDVRPCPAAAGNARFVRFVFLEWWAARLAAAGSTAQARAQARFRVAMTFEHSDSNARSWVRAAMAEALGRPADPSGQAYWMAWLTGRGRWRTFQLWTHQLASEEAYRRSQTQSG